MAEAEKEKEAAAVKSIAEIGEQLAAFNTCPNKRTLVKLLKQAISSFLELKQSESLESSVKRMSGSNSSELELSESLKSSVKSMSDSLIKHGLLVHEDRDIKILVGTCFCEIIRVLSPNPDLGHTVTRDIFKLILSIFGELDDVASPYFLRRVELLETFAKLPFCSVMQDSRCEGLFLKMTKSLFSVVRVNHPPSVFNSMSLIIRSMLEERVDADSDPLGRNTSQSLLDVILQNIIKERKSVASASSKLAVSVIQNCGKKLEFSVCQFLTSCILNRDAVRSAIKESYHEIILEIYQIAPQLLLAVIPNLTHELLTDQVDVRIKALNLIRKLLALRGQQFPRDYPHVFTELLNRFSDKSAEVRLTALSCAKALYMTNQSGRESFETLSAIQGRLLDHDDKVRVEAVDVVCELAKTNLNFKLSDLITQAAERLRDKKVLVRSKSLKKLVELYQGYCTRCAAGITLLNEQIEEIPCKVLMLCYEKDCQEFRPQSMELVLADLFPASLSFEERTRHWIFIFSLFKPPHLKALKTILSQKQRLRVGLNEYLDLRNRAEDNVSEEAEKITEALVVKMSSCFPDPAKAKNCFQKLTELNDSGIFNVLQQFLRNQTALDAETVKDMYLRELGAHKELFEFVHLLSKKCSFNIFSSEHVHYILDCLSSDEAEKKHLKNHQVQLLLTILSAFPSLIRGSEKQFQILLLEREIPLNKQLIEMLAREGYHMSIKLSDIYPSLEKICLEGTRGESKLAVSAIAALAGTSDQFIFPKLCKMLVDSLCNGQNVPTVLQSLGCLAQHSISTFEDQEKLIKHYILEEIFQPDDALTSKDLDIFDESSNCCSSCKLKIYGLKALVKSFLPHKQACLTRPVRFLLDIIQQILQRSGFSAGSIPCEHDKAFIRLAAAKSILRLSRKWDLHISPLIFRLTILMAKDHSPGVRRSFVSKVQKMLNNHSVPSRYACAFSFVALDPLEDLRSDALKYLEQFIQKYCKGDQICETMTMQESANHPVYLVVFLIHVLAHDPNFPAPDCRDEKIYAEFLSPLFVTVQALVNAMLVDDNLRLEFNASLYLRSIFNAIKRAEDAVDAQMTPKLHVLAAVGISILDSLNINSTLVPRTPGLVLLPSSLYKSGSSETREANNYPSIGCKADASFSKRLISCLKFEVSGIVQTGTNHRQQHNENSLRPSGTRHPDKSSHLKSVILNNKFSAENTHEKPALSQNEVIESCSKGDDAVNKCDSSFAEPFKLSRDGDQVKVFTSKNTQIIESNGETLVGKQIKLWSPIEKCYYSGLVDSFDPTKSTHQIIYETGEVDVLSLDSETWEIDMEDLQARYCGEDSANDQAKFLEANGHDSKQENLLKKRENCIREVSQPVKRTKRRAVAIDTSTSEAIDMNLNDRATRKSRRRKV